MENQESKSTNLYILKVISVLWLLWGIVHALGGIRILVSDTVTKVQSKASAVDPASLQLNYPDAIGGILNQHGFNLLWFGVITVVGAYFIWKNNKSALALNALVGGLADLGYLLFLDLPGYSAFFPGRVMTFVSGTAIVLSVYIYFKVYRKVIN